MTCAATIPANELGAYFFSALFSWGTGHGLGSGGLPFLGSEFAMTNM